MLVIIFCFHYTSTFEVDSVLGLAYQNSICTKYNGVFVGIHNPYLNYLATVAAHEIGHTLNMVHDETFTEGMYS